MATRAVEAGRTTNSFFLVPIRKKIIDLPFTLRPLIGEKTYSLPILAAMPHVLDP